MVDCEASDADSQVTTSLCQTADWWLKQVQELIPSVIGKAYLAKAFICRWIIIRRKLEQLPGQLEELADSPGFANAALSKELLQSIDSTLHESKELADKCSDHNYGGKLQMQSNLDALTMKLALHLQDCQLLLRSDILRELAPSNLAHPSSASKREVIKWNVKDLLARLQIGSLESKQKPLDSMVELMQEDDKNVLDVAGQGGIPTLVHLLDAGMVTIREKAAAAVCCLSQADGCERLLVSESALPPLVRLLESGSPLAKEKAAATLQTLTSTPENARSVAAHGGVSALIDICQNGTPGSQASGVGTLRNLSKIAEVRHAVAEEGAIPVMIGLITSGTTMAQEHAADVLNNLSSSDDKLRSLIVGEGGVGALLMYFDLAVTAGARELAMRGLRNIAASGENIESLITAGFLPRLVAALKSGHCMLQQASAAAVSHLARSMELRRLLGEAGCIPPLVKMLEAKTSSAQEMAAQAVFSLIPLERNRREIRKEENCILGMVRLLDPSNQNISKKYPISVLLCLAGSKKCRKLMISAGACGRLEKLAEMEVLGARKLLDRLEKGGLWGAFRV
eukprot:c12080_g1_i1 orf=547-2250(+)